MIATCAVIGGAETWDVIAEYGQTKKTFVLRFLTLENGIPSPDTFGRVFAKLNPTAFSQAFGRWMAAACEGSGWIPIVIDGTSARSAPRATATGRLHLVRAWATENRLTLGQVSVPDGSNEIAVIPELLRALELAGVIVTIDAAGCQVENAKIICDQGRSHRHRVGLRPTTPPVGPCQERVSADGPPEGGQHRPLPERDRVHWDMLPHDPCPKSTAFDSPQGHRGHREKKPVRD